MLQSKRQFCEQPFQISATIYSLHTKNMPQIYAEYEACQKTQNMRICQNIIICKNIIICHNIIICKNIICQNMILMPEHDNIPEYNNAIKRKDEASYFV